MPELDYKLIVIGALFAALFLIKFLSGGRPYDRPVRRPRRFGYKGTMSPLRQAENEEENGKTHLSVVEPGKPDEQPPDPEKEFFGEK
jgi:hypothetical protein